MGFVRVESVKKLTRFFIKASSSLTVTHSTKYSEVRSAAILSGHALCAIDWRVCVICF